MLALEISEEYGGIFDRRFIFMWKYPILFESVSNLDPKSEVISYYNTKRNSLYCVFFHVEVFSLWSPNDVGNVATFKVFAKMTDNFCMYMVKCIYKILFAFPTYLGFLTYPWKKGNIIFILSLAFNLSLLKVYLPVHLLFCWTWHQLRIDDLLT